jgi:hypothetical protein
VLDLYPRVSVGAQVTVTWNRFKSGDGYASKGTASTGTGRGSVLREMRQSDVPTKF